MGRWKKHININNSNNIFIIIMLIGRKHPHAIFKNVYIYKRKSPDSVQSWHTVSSYSLKRLQTGFIPLSCTRIFSSFPLYDLILILVTLFHLLVSTYSTLHRLVVSRMKVGRKTGSQRLHPSAWPEVYRCRETQTITVETWWWTSGSRALIPIIIIITLITIMIILSRRRRFNYPGGVNRERGRELRLLFMPTVRRRLQWNSN